MQASTPVIDSPNLDASRFTMLQSKVFTLPTPYESLLGCPACCLWKSGCTYLRATTGRIRGFAGSDVSDSDDHADFSKQLAGD